MIKLLPEWNSEKEEKFPLHSFVTNFIQDIVVYLECLIMSGRLRFIGANQGLDWINYIYRRSDAQFLNSALYMALRLGGYLQTIGQAKDSEKRWGNYGYIDL